MFAPLICTWLCVSLGFAQTPVVHHVLGTEAGDQYFVVTKTGHAWGVLEGAAHELREVLLREALDAHRGWALDLRLKDRRRVAITSGSARRAAVDRPHSYLIHPDRAPERLVSYAVDDAALARLGLAQRVALPTSPPPRRTPREIDMPKDAVVLLITPPTIERAAFDERLNALTEILSVLPNKTASYVLAVAPGSDVARITAAVKGAGAHAAIALDKARLASRKELTREEAIFTLQSDVANPWWTLNAVLALAEDPAADDVALGAARRGLDQFARILQTLRDALPRGRYTRSWTTTPFEWDQMTTGERLTLARNATRLTKLYGELIDPLNDLYVEALRRFKNLDHDAAERMLLKTAVAAGPAGLELMSTEAWLRWLDERIDRLAEVPSPRSFEELRALGFFVDRSNRGLGDLRVTLKLVDASRPVDRNLDQMPMWPLRQLGYLGDHRALRERLLDFIIRADHRVAASLPPLERSAMFESLLPVEPNPAVIQELRSYLSTGHLTEAERLRLQTDEFTERFRRVSRDARIDGSAVIHKLLSALRWPPQQVGPTDPDFNLNLYHQNAIELLTDLLLTADDTLMTRGTYVSALEVASQLARLKPRSGMGAVVTRRLLEHVSDLAEGCAQNLKPDVGGLKNWRDLGEALPSN